MPRAGGSACNSGNDNIDLRKTDRQSSEEAQSGNNVGGHCYSDSLEIHSRLLISQTP